MKGQVGYWGGGRGGLAIGFSAEMLDWLDRQDTGRRVAVHVARDRTVIVMPERDGEKVRRREAPDGRSRVCRDYYGSEMAAGAPASLTLDLDLVPFGLTEVEFLEEAGCLSTELGADHELAWPRLRVDCQTYEAEQLAVQALEARMLSLVASGQTSFRSDQRMPDYLRRLLPSGAWQRAIETAKSLAGVK